MHFYHLAELLEDAIQQWSATHAGPPLDDDDVKDLAFTVAEALLERTELPIDPPTQELPGSREPR